MTSENNEAVVNENTATETEEVISPEQKFKTDKTYRRKRINAFFYFPALILFLEFSFKLFVYKSVPGIPYTLLFSLVWGGLFTFIISSFGEKANRIISIILSILVSLWFCVQCVNYSIFTVPLTLNSVFFGAEKATNDFLGTTFYYIFNNIIPIIVFYLPTVLFWIFSKKYYCFEKSKKAKKYSIFSAATLFVATILSIVIIGLFPQGRYDYTAYSQYYSSSFDITISQKKMGVLTGLRLDLQHFIAGPLYPTSYDGHLDESGISSYYDTPESSVAEDPKPVEIDRSPQTMKIDFDELIANETDENIVEMHNYFKNVTPTKKNEYTGIYKDCNLIYMCCEGFSQYAVDKELTPTLYKLVNEGIVFENFYTPLWGVSTSDGEYVTCQGLIPKSGVWSFFRSGLNHLPFALGNQFLKKDGYSAPRAYHNHSYDYYDRHVSHPNLGYIYKGYGGGVDPAGNNFEGIAVEKTWPESDLEMIQKSLPEYINEDKFHTYYMTVSGHLQYNFSGNAMAAKHKDDVAHLEHLSEECRAYIACNMELDKAMEYLLSELEKAGKLENTVIVMGADHYPYGLEKEQIDEIAGHEVEENFEIYENTAVIWKYGAEKKVITEPVCSMDLLPTVSNMFGLEYDSRLLMGRDIFGDTMPLVIFNNRSFVTDKCSYNSTTGEIINFTDGELPEDYIITVKNIVANRFKFSTKILETDYYAKVFGVESRASQ